MGVKKSKDRRYRGEVDGGEDDNEAQTSGQIPHVYTCE